MYMLKVAINMLLGRDYIMGDILWPSRKRVAQYRDNIQVGKRVLDMGTGSGVLAKLALEKGAEEVTAADINPAAVAQAKKHVPRANVVHSNMFENIEGEYDTIIFAAPWSDGEIKEVSQHAIYDCGVMGPFFRGAKKHLSDGGHLWVQYSDAAPENFSAFLELIGAEGYRIDGSWSYSTWDILAKRNANVILYKMSLKQCPD